MPCRHICCGPANDRSICIASPGYTRAPTAPLIGLYPIYNYQRQRRRSRNGCERETKGRLGESKKKKESKVMYCWRNWYIFFKDIVAWQSMASFTYYFNLSGPWQLNILGVSLILTLVSFQEQNQFQRSLQLAYSFLYSGANHLNTAFQKGVKKRKQGRSNVCCTMAVAFMRILNFCYFLGLSELFTFLCTLNSGKKGVFCLLRLLITVRPNKVWSCETLNDSDDRQEDLCVQSCTCACVRAKTTAIL